MKIISISPYNFFQRNSGVTNRIFYISQYLDNNYQTLHIIRNQNFSIHDTCSFKGEIYLGGKNKYTHLLNFSVIKEVLSHKDDSILFCHTLWGGIYGIFINKLFGVEYIFDNHNVEYLRFKRTGKFYWNIVKSLEKWVIKSSKITYVCSNNDKEFLQKNLIDSEIEVIENGVSINTNIINNQEEISYNIKSLHGLLPDEKLLFYSGNRDYIPNAEAFEYIITKIIPKLPKNYRFIISGSGYESFITKYPNIIFTGSINNIFEYIISADLLVAPLLSGSGTKLKVLEALGYGLKVLTTPIGAEGIPEDDNLIIMNEINSNSIEKLLELNGNSKKINNNYSWEKSLTKLRLLHEI